MQSQTRSHRHSAAMAANSTVPVHFNLNQEPCPRIHPFLLLRIHPESSSTSGPLSSEHPNSLRGPLAIQSSTQPLPLHFGHYLKRSSLLQCTLLDYPLKMHSPLLETILPRRKIDFFLEATSPQTFGLQRAPWGPHPIFGTRASSLPGSQHFVLLSKPRGHYHHTQSPRRAVDRYYSLFTFAAHSAQQIHPPRPPRS